MSQMMTRFPLLAILLLSILPLGPAPAAGEEDPPLQRVSLVMYPPRTTNADEAAVRELPRLAREELAREGIVVLDPAEPGLDPERQFGRALEHTIARGATGWGYVVLTDHPGDDRNDVAVLRVFNLRCEGIELGSGGFTSLDEETSFTKRLDKLSAQLRRADRVRGHLEAGLARRDSAAGVGAGANPLDATLLFRRRAEFVRHLALNGRLGGAQDWNARILAAERDIASGHEDLGFIEFEDWFARTKKRPQPRWNPRDDSETKMVCFESLLAGLVAMGALTKAPAEMKPLLAQHRACVEFLEKGDLVLLGRRIDVAGMAGNVLVERLMAERDRMNEEAARRGKAQLNEAPPPASP